MKKNLTTIGNSLGIIIEKPILDLLGITRETPLEMMTDGHRLIIEPVNATARAARVDAAIKRVMKKHHETLKKLAE